MILKTLFSILLCSLEIYAQFCKEPEVAKRLLSDDVRYASPFYVIAVPRNAHTEQMDNICYSYFDQGSNFFHIMSITYKNGTNTYHTYTKGDLSNRMGLAVGSGVFDSECVFHDYTLTPICNATVFVLYRCFVDGSCHSNIDIGITPGVDVRVVLAAHPIVSDSCRTETELNLQNTSTLAGGNYVILPQKLAPQCITRYNNTNSIGFERAVGSKHIPVNQLEERFGFSEETNTVKAPVNPSQWPLYNSPSVNKHVFNPYGSTIKTSGVRPGYTAVPTWAVHNNQWTYAANGHTQWDNGPQMAGHTHGIKTKTTVGENPNVVYHVHSWDNVPPTCRCN